MKRKRQNIFFIPHRTEHVQHTVHRARLQRRMKTEFRLVTGLNEQNETNVLYTEAQAHAHTIV